MNRLKQITAKAKILYKTGKYKKWTDAIKQASKSLGATKSTPKSKSGSHKDTKSHNVNVSVVSGAGKGKTISLAKAKEIASHWHGGQWSALYQFASSGKVLNENFHRYLNELPNPESNLTTKDKNDIVKLITYIYHEHKRLYGGKKMGAVKIIQKGETPKSKVTKVLQQVRTKKGQFKGYKKIGSVTSANAKQLVIDSIDASGYGENPKTPDEKIRFLEKTFLSEYGWAVSRYGKQRAIQEWLMGLPSSIHLPFANYDILQLAKSWGTLPYNATERQEDKILSNYWKLMASTILKLFNQRKKK